MRFKTYTGSHTELSQLMQNARQDLGPDAVIKTEYFTEGGFFGIGARKMVKVTAGIEEAPSESPFAMPSGLATTVTTEPSPWQAAPHSNGKAPSKVPSESALTPEVEEALPEVVETPEVIVEIAAVEETTSALPEHAPSVDDAIADAVVDPVEVAEGDQPLLPHMPSPELTPPASEHAMLAEVLSELKALRSEVDTLKTGTPTASIAPLFPHFVATAFESLIENEVSPALARKIADAVNNMLSDDDKQHLDTVVSAMTEHIIEHAVARPIEEAPVATKPRVIMLLGPTGVGKTTTLAKLAASFSLVDDQQVGLITADTYRIAAIDQLRTFSQIISLPLEVVFDPTEFNRAIEINAHQDVILVDTAGRSPKDEARLGELKEFLAIEHPVETILCIAATTRPQDMQLILDRFGAVGLDGIIITKIDETSALGPAVELLYETHLPLRFLTNGQNVPDDIIRGDQRELTRQLVAQLFR